MVISGRCPSECMEVVKARFLLLPTSVVRTPPAAAGQKPQFNIAISCPADLLQKPDVVLVVVF